MNFTNTIIDTKTTGVINERGYVGVHTKITGYFETCYKTIPIDGGLVITAIIDRDNSFYITLSGISLRDLIYIEDIICMSGIYDDKSDLDKLIYDFYTKVCKSRVESISNDTASLYYFINGEKNYVVRCINGLIVQGFSCTDLTDLQDSSCDFSLMTYNDTIHDVAFDLPLHGLTTIGVYDNVMHRYILCSTITSKHLDTSGELRMYDYIKDTSIVYLNDNFSNEFSYNDELSSIHIHRNAHSLDGIELIVNGNDIVICNDINMLVGILYNKRAYKSIIPSTDNNDDKNNYYVLINMDKDLDEYCKKFYGDTIIYKIISDPDLDINSILDGDIIIAMNKLNETLHELQIMDIVSEVDCGLNNVYNTLNGN